jgi:hypothetical protein
LESYLLPDVTIASITQETPDVISYTTKQSQPADEEGKSKKGPITDGMPGHRTATPFIWPLSDTVGWVGDGFLTKRHRGLSILNGDDPIETNVAGKDHPMPGVIQLRFNRPQPAETMTNLLALLDILRNSSLVSMKYSRLPAPLSLNRRLLEYLMPDIDEDDEDDEEGAVAAP